MMLFLWTLWIGGCDGRGCTGPDAPGHVGNAPAPASLRSLRYGDIFLRRCWFGSLQADQVEAIALAATEGQKQESAARTAVSGTFLELTQRVATGNLDGLNTAAQALVKEERALLSAEYATLVALASALPAVRMDDGSAASIAVALAESLSTNPAFLQADPYTRTDPSLWPETDLPALVQSQLDLRRGEIQFVSVLESAAIQASALNTESDAWKGEFTALVEKVLDAWAAQRLTLVDKYASYMANLPSPARDRLILRGDVRGPLQLPQLNDAPPNPEGGSQGRPEISAPNGLPPREEGHDRKEGDPDPSHHEPPPPRL